MKSVFKFLSAGLVIAAFGLSACSNNDDDEPKNNQSVETSPKNVLSQGLPAEVDGCTFTTNEKGQVTSILLDSESRVITTFEYGKFTRSEEYDVKMKTIDWYGDSEFYIQTNNQGYATRALEVSEYGDFTWDFEYNTDGQLTLVKTSEGNTVFTITYANGDITKVAEDNDYEGHKHYEYTFNYTNDEHPSGIPNKGNIMLYDELYEVDLDGMELAYYAGLLGKSTNKLPLEKVESSYSDSYTWGLNSNGLPVELNGDSIFSWK